jgi:transcription termination factor NusB
MEIQKCVTFFDNLVDLVIKHDENYDNEITELVLNTLDQLDRELTSKLTSILDIHQAS